MSCAGTTKAAIDQHSSTVVVTMHISGYLDIPCGCHECSHNNKHIYLMVLVVLVIQDSPWAQPVPRVLVAQLHLLDLWVQCKNLYIHAHDIDANVENILG